MHLIKPKRSNFYQLVYLKNGKRTSITTKSTTKKAAYKFLLEFKEHLQQRKSIPKKSISDFRKEYEKYISETKSKNYLRSVKLSFNQFIDFTGEIDLNDISIRLVEKFIQNTYSRANYAAALYYRTLKAALSSALRWNYMDNNPFDQIKVPKQISKHPLFISRSELDTIRESIKNSQIRNMMLISYDAGLRLSEVINLRWSNIDLQHKILTVSNDSIFQTKNKKDRIIPLTNRLYNIFLRKAPNIFKVPTNNELVFSNKSGLIYNADYVSRTFKKVIRELKFNEGYTYHTLRHSFASQLVQKGVSLYIVKELMGHQDIRTTQIYSHLETKNLFEAVDKLNTLFI